MKSNYFFKHPSLSLWFKLALLSIFVVLTNHGILLRIETIGINTALAAYAFLWLVCIAAVCLVSFTNKFFIRFFWGLIISLSAFCGDFFYRAIGYHMGIDDLELMWRVRGDADMALDFYWPIFLESLGLTVLGFFAILLPLHDRYAIHTNRLKLGVATAPLLPIFLISYIIYARGGEGTNGLPNQISPAAMAGFVSIYNVIFEREISRENVAMIPAAEKNPKHVVLIIDESIRADYLDINSEHGLITNLVNRDNIANFGYAASASNCSDATNLILRMGGTKDTMPTALNSNPSIWSYASTAGYETTYIDAQTSNGDLHNFMTEEEKNEIDHFIQIDDDVEMHNKDFAAAQVIKDLLKNDHPQFIYFVKNGAHWPYEGKYPRERSFYKPYMEPNEAPGVNLEHMANSYKNTIHWTVGEFFSEFLSDLDLSEHVVIYTADHAQNLNHKRQGGFMSHCSTYNEHPTEGLVPLLTITDSPKYSQELADAAKINFDKASHYNLFSTLLLMFGYPEQDVLPRYGESLMQSIDTKQEYLVVPLFVKFGRPLRWQAIPQRDTILLN